MFKCFESDPAFDGYALDCYQFPTRLIRLPFTPPLPGIQEIADGLKTFIEERYDGYRHISLVAHSLGGIIARQYILAEIRAGQMPPVERLALVAVPSTGSALANVGQRVSLVHRQLRAITQDHDSLTELNIQWEQMQVQDQIDVRYLFGGCDRAVPYHSELPFVSRENRSMLIDADHRSIICPNGRLDIRYTTLKRFILQSESNKQFAGIEAALPLFPQMAPISDSPFSPPQPDPLFDIYKPKDERYYIHRTLDNIIGQTIGASHLWLVGESGTGKTAALRRSIYLNGWHLNHLSLGGYEVADASQLHRALCVELAGLVGVSDVPGIGASIAEQFAFVRNLLRSFPKDSTIANLVEEIPLDEAELVNFGNLVSKLIQHISSDEDLHGRVRFAISSIHDVRRAPEPMSPKACETLQMIPADRWAPVDIRELVTVLTSSIKPDLPDSAQHRIMQSANGSPRFVKQVFRQLRNGLHDGGQIDGLITSVQSEQAR